MSPRLYGNGGSVQYEYDDKGRIIKETFEDDQTVTYRYDNDGALATVIDSESGITAVYTYDLIGRLARYAETGTDHSLILNYTYDQEGKLTYLAETINGEWRGIYYYYDANDRVRLVDKGNGGRGYTYDDFGRISQKYTRHKGYTRITDDFVYTTNGNKTSAQVAQHTISAGVNTDHLVTTTYSYTYDDNGNILTVSDGTHTTSYTYDSANQLIRENNQAGGFTHTWTYDNAGNILTRKEYAYTTGSLGQPTDTVTYTYGDDGWGDLLTAYDGNTITYDEIGNPLNDGTWTYTWQHGRELVSMTDGTASWNFTYNADGLRTKRTNGTITYSYAYVGSELEKLTIGTEKLAFAYDAGGTPLTVRWNGTYYFYLTNLQGDVIAITDPDGTVVVTYTYDAWGNILSTTGSMASTLGQYNPLRYRGYVYDQETGLYYLQSRYYNPETGRFINADCLLSTSQDLLGNNMFAYCGNNPVMFDDPSGYIRNYNVMLTDSGGINGAKVGAARECRTGKTGRFNCFGYALGEEEVILLPTEFKQYIQETEYGVEYDMEELGNLVINEVQKYGMSIRPIDSYDSRIMSYEYRIAFRVGQEDFHFVVQGKDGRWYFKPGDGLKVMLLDGIDPSKAPWHGYDNGYESGIATGEILISNYYDSPTLYFAVAE